MTAIRPGRASSGPPSLPLDTQVSSHESAPAQHGGKAGSSTGTGMLPAMGEHE